MKFPFLFAKLIPLLVLTTSDSTAYKRLGRCPSEPHSLTAMLSQANYYGGPVCLNPFVTSDSDSLQLIQTCFHRRPMAVMCADKIIFSDNGSNCYVNTRDYINSANLDGGPSNTIDLRLACQNVPQSRKIPAFDVIPDCVPEKLRCKSVTKVTLDKKNEQPILVSFTSRSQNWLDISLLDITEATRESSPPKKQCVSHLGAMLSRDEPPTFSVKECYYNGNSLPCKSFSHSSDINTCGDEGGYLIQYFSTSGIFNQNMVEDKVYPLYISSYQNAALLRDMCKSVPNIFLFNEALKMMQQIPLPMHQISQNKSKDANAYGIGGFMKHLGEIYFIAPEQFTCFGNIWAPIGDKNQSTGTKNKAYRHITDFTRDLKTIFTGNQQQQQQPSPQPPPPPSSSSSIRFTSMWIIHNSPKVIKKILGNTFEDDSSRLFALVDDTNVRYFDSYQKLLQWIKTTATTPVSHQPALAVAVGTCLDSPALLKVNVIDRPFNGWREALDCITNMDEIKIFVDGQMATKDDLIKCGSYLISGQLIVVGSGNKKMSSSSIARNLLAPLSSILVWNESDSEPMHYSGFKGIPPGNPRLVPRTSIESQELWIDESTRVTVSDFTTYLMNNKFANNMISQHLSLVVYQIGVICTEGELRSVIDLVKTNVVELMVTCRNNLATNQITREEFNGISDNLDSFLSTLARTDGGGITSATTLVQRLNIASNVEEVKKRGLNVMDMDGSCLIFDISGENSIHSSANIPLLLHYQKTKLDAIPTMEMSTFTSRPNTFILANLPPRNKRAFVYPMCNDITVNITRVASEDWLELAARPGLPTDLIRIKMREIIGQQIHSAPQSGEVSVHLQRLLMSLVRVLSDQKTEFYTNVNKNLFVSLTLCLMTSNRSTNIEVGRIFQAGVKMGKKFFNKEINVEIIKHLIHLLHVTDYEDKALVLENLKNNVQGFIDFEYLQPLAKKDLQRKKDELGVVGTRLVSTVETVLMNQLSEFIDWNQAMTVADVKRLGKMKLMIPSDECVINVQPDRLIQLAHWFMQLLTQQYKIQDLKLEAGGEGDGECFRTLNYLRGIASEYVSPAKKFGLGRKSSGNHFVGRIAYVLYYYLQRSHCSDHDSFTFNIKKTVAECALKNQQGDLWAKVKEHCAVIPGPLKKTITKIRHCDEVYSAMLDDIFNQCYTVDDNSGLFHQACIKKWADVLGQHKMSNQMGKIGEWFSVHPPLASLLICVSKAIEGFESISPKTVAFVRLINYALMRQHPEHIGLKSADVNFFLYSGQPTMAEFGLNEAMYRQCITWMTKGVSVDESPPPPPPSSPQLFVDDVALFNGMRAEIKILGGSDSVRTVAVLRAQLADSHGKKLLELCDCIDSFDRGAVLKLS